MEVRRIRADIGARDGWDTVEMIVLRGCSATGVIAEFQRFLKSFARELPRDDIIRLPRPSDQVERDCRKLRGRSALQKQDFIVVGNPHQLPQIGFRAGNDRFVIRRAMRHLHNRHSALPVTDQFRCGGLQHRQGKHGRPCRKIIDPIHLRRSSDIMVCQKVYIYYTHFAYCCQAFLRNSGNIFFNSLVFLLFMQL